MRVCVCLSKHMTRTATTRGILSLNGEKTYNVIPKQMEQKRDIPLPDVPPSPAAKPHVTESPALSLNKRSFGASRSGHSAVRRDEKRTPGREQVA